MSEIWKRLQIGPLNVIVMLLVKLILAMESGLSTVRVSHMVCLLEYLV